MNFELSNFELEIYMPLTTSITVRSQIVRTPRVMQVEGLFDLPAAAEAVLHWDVSLPLEEKPWHIGLIVGPSGCGKSTVARHLFGEALAAQEKLPAWPEDRAVLDAFPAEMPVKDVVALLSSVGFSSPPAWLRPFRVLSTGEQFRVSLARLLAFAPESLCEKGSDPLNSGGRTPFRTGSKLAVMDEYTSVVDRTVARIGSAALAKTVRRRGGRFIAVTCHEDVEEWLQPDWVYRPAVNGFAWRCLQRRPEIQLAISRTDRRLWRLFRAHHYLSTALAPAAVCFVARWHERPVAFSAWITVPGSRTKREHRTVVLPDYQGVGLGHALSGFCAALWKALGYRVTSTTTHPAFVAARQRSPDWRLRRPPSLGRPSRGRWAHLRHATTRLTAGFEYVGPALDPLEARALLLMDRRGRTGE